MPQPTSQPHISVRDLTMAYGDFVIQRDLDFAIERGSIFIVMGGSGCGKSTLLRHMIGLVEPARGEVLYGGGVIDGPGYYVEPTIIKMPVDAPILQIETFAPILYLLEFDSVEEAIKINNGVTQGAVVGDLHGLGRLW